MKIGDFVKVSNHWPVDTDYIDGKSGLVVKTQARGNSPGAFVLFEKGVHWIPQEKLTIIISREK